MKKCKKRINFNNNYSDKIHTHFSFFIKKSMTTTTSATKRNYYIVFLIMLTFFVISFLTNIIGALIPDIKTVFISA